MGHLEVPIKSSRVMEMARCNGQKSQNNGDESVGSGAWETVPSMVLLHFSL
ncbi:MAG: hypothetical protein IPO26_19495 [Saprospiraceae bacterium]|nr:hypothetical protein [Saprospiraceae bacterium]